MSRTDKTALLLMVATWRFDVIKNCLALIAFKTSDNTVSACEHFLFTAKCHKLHVLSQPLSKTRDSFVLRKISRVFSSKTFNLELCLASDEAFKKASCIAPQTWCLQGFKFGQLGSQLFLLNHTQKFACRHWWATRAVCTEPHASHWICCSVRQQSTAVFNKFWKHTLVNSFIYYLQNISTKIRLQWRHCRVKLLLLFVEMNKN